MIVVAHNTKVKKIKQYLSIKKKWRELNNKDLQIYANS